MTTTTAPLPPAAPLTSRVRIEHEKYIPVSKHRIKEALFKKLREAGREEDLSPFTDFLRLIEAIYHFEYHTLVEEIKRDYEVFEAGRNSEVLASMTPEEIKVAEDRFLSNFLTVMEKGNFAPLTQADVDLAEGESYLFNLPVVIDWDKLDPDLLARYFSEHAYGKEGEKRPEFANRILVFKRGVGVDRTEGRFIGQKFEMLLSKFFGWLLHLALAPFRKGKKEEPHEEAGEEDAGGRKGEKSHMHKTRWIERVTLKKSGIDFKSLFKKTTLQEATFDRLVILYRPATPAKKKKDAADPPKDHSIHIKTFREIPMADMEIVFPYKKLSMHMIDRIKLAVTGIAGAVVCILKGLTLVILAPIGAYLAKLYNGYRVSKQRYQSVLAQSLYHKSLDNDVGVLFYLLDSLEAQEFKEAVLAYFFLWKYGPMAMDELDSTCETFLVNAFRLEVDFEVDDALDKLLREKIVEQEGEKYRAKPLLEALEVLDHKWDNYFKYNVD